MKLGRVTGYALLVAGALLTAAGASKADMKAGLLKCQIEAGFGYIISSAKELECKFQRAGGMNEHYGGKGLSRLLRRHRIWCSDDGSCDRNNM